MKRLPPLTPREARLLAAVREKPDAPVKALAKAAGLTLHYTYEVRRRLDVWGLWPDVPNTTSTRTPGDTPTMTRRQLNRLVEAWHRDNRALFGEARQSRQRELWAALASIGGEHDTGTLLAVCDDVEPFVAVFELMGSRNHLTHPCHRGNPRRLQSLRRLNAERFATARKAVAS